MLEQGGPGGELEGQQLQPFVNRFRFHGFQGQVMHGAVAEHCGQIELEGPFPLRQGVWRHHRQEHGVVDPQLQGGSATGPAPDLVASHASEPGPAPEAEETEILQAGVAFCVEAQGTAGQLHPSLGVEEGPQHEPPTMGGEFHTGVTEEEESAVPFQHVAGQIGPGSMGQHLGQLPAAGGIEQILQREGDLEGAPEPARPPSAGPASDPAGAQESL